MRAGERERERERERESFEVGDEKGGSPAAGMRLNMKTRRIDTGDRGRVRKMPARVSFSWRCGKAFFVCSVANTLLSSGSVGLLFLHPVRRNYEDVYARACGGGVRGFAFGSRLCGRFGNRPGERVCDWESRGFWREGCAVLDESRPQHANSNLDHGLQVAMVSCARLVHTVSGLLRFAQCFSSQHAIVHQQHVRES